MPGTSSDGSDSESSTSTSQSDTTIQKDTDEERMSFESADSNGSFMSTFSTASVRKDRWQARSRMEILQFKGMSRVLEHVHRWVEGKFYGIAQQLYGDDGSDPASAKAKLIQETAVLWGDEQQKQIDLLRMLYDKMVHNCNLGDWELGYKSIVQKEDGLGALVEMCGAVGRNQPILAWAALMCAVQHPDGSGLNLSRFAHVLTKVAQRCRKVKLAMRSSFDMLFWLLADQLASVDAAAVVPSNKQRHLLHAALCRLVPFSHDQMLSQLLLQLLLLSYCIPSPAELKKGSPDTCAFLNMLTHAVVKASQAAPGVILFVEVQLSFVIASVFMCLNPAPTMMEAALSAGLLGLMHKILNCQTSKPLRLDISALRGARIADGEHAANKLLTGAQRELCSLIGVVKLVFVTICGHMEPAARKACVMQLSPPAMLDVCTVVHHLLARPDRALAGGTAQAEIDLLARVADDIVPETSDWFLTLVGARCLHTVSLWQRCQQKVTDFARQPAVIQAMKHGGIGDAYATNTYAMMFLAGTLQEYRPLAEDWGRIRRLVEDTCAEAEQMLKLVPLLASPVKGPLFDFMELDVDMVPVTPATCSLQHLAQCALKPAWLADQDRPSVVDPRPPKPRASFHAALEAMEGTPTDMRDGLLDKQLVNVQRMDTVAFSVGGALFHAVALSCEQNSPVMRAKLQKVSNIYKQVIPMRSVGNLDDTSMYEAFTLACEFMYTAEIEELEDAEVAINVWMVASALVIRDLPRYVHAKVLQLLPAAHLHLVPGLFRQALAAWHLCRSSRPDMEEEGASIMQAVMELIMCKLQDLVKKKVLHKITEEHGAEFQDRLAAAIGLMLGMEPELPPQRDSFTIFKYVAAAEGSADFWRQLAAGIVIVRHAKVWVARRRGERRRRAEAERRSAMADPTAIDSGSLMLALPQQRAEAAGAATAAKKKAKVRAAKVALEVPTEEAAEAPEAKEEAPSDSEGSDDGEEALPEQESDVDKRVAKKAKKARKKREDEGVAYLGAEAPKKETKDKNKKKKRGDEAKVEKGPEVEEEVRPGSSAGALDSMQTKAEKKKKKGKKMKDDAKSKRATITAADEAELLIKEELRRVDN